MKFAVITTTRAEYGIMMPLIKKMELDSELEVHTIVSGTHLLSDFGNTQKYIYEDKVNISYKIPIYNENFKGTEIDVADAIANAVREFAIVFRREKYSGIIVLGDRYELLGICEAAMICRIPIIHIHGGEITEGAIDDKIRHAISKMSSVHFPSVKEYAKRVIQLGENPDMVFPVGALGIDNIINFSYIEPKIIKRELDIPGDKRVSIVTFHPMTGLDSINAEMQTEEFMKALEKIDVYSIITMPNADVGGKEVYNVIAKYADKNNEKMKIYKSLGQKRYLSLMRCADIMIGNSSSGIIESASFALPTVNVGDRQKGRMAPKNVISCRCKETDIIKAIDKGLSKEFRESLQGLKNPYGDGSTADKIVNILKKIDWSNSNLIQKHFFDI